MKVRLLRVSSSISWADGHCSAAVIKNETECSDADATILSIVELGTLQWVRSSPERFISHRGLIEA